MRFLAVLIVIVIAVCARGFRYTTIRARFARSTTLSAKLEYDSQGYLVKTRESGWFNGLSTNPGDSLSDPRAVPPPAKAFAEKVKSGINVTFEEAIALIDEHYLYISVPFQNGDVSNAAGENTDVAKILAFGLITQMNKEQTLSCFGDAYRKLSKEGNDHENIRAFTKNGFDGVVFDRGIPISSKLQSGDDTDSVMDTQAYNEGEGEWGFDSDSWLP
jgi:hypothetical protein